VLPLQRVLLWVAPVLFVRVPAIALIGVWFLLRALEGSLGLSTPGVHTGIAFFAHVGGFAFGLTAATMMLGDAWTRRALHLSESRADQEQPKTVRPRPPRCGAQTPPAGYGRGASDATQLG
jgi:membrane associated rhomboid family serine protease